MSNNLQDIFDATIGNGGAAPDFYKSGANTDEELLAEIEAQAEHFYKAITSEEAQKILKTIRK